MTREWLAMEQALELLSSTSRTTVYRFVREHGVRVSKPLGRTYFNYADIMAVFERCAVKLEL